MQNHRRIPPPVPAFKPVPRQRDRQDGWTPERQQGFIEALADTGSVKHAVARVGMSPEGAYMLRRAPGAESFAQAWLAALDHGIRQLEDIALDRAINGVEQPVYSYGKLIGTRTVYNDRLIMFMLRNRAIERFGPSTAYVSGRMKKKIADEALAEHFAQMPSMDEVRASIKRKIDAIERHTLREEARKGIIRLHLEGEEARDFERWRAARAEGRVMILPGEGGGEDVPEP